MPQEALVGQLVGAGAFRVGHAAQRRIDGDVRGGEFGQRLRIALRARKRHSACSAAPNAALSTCAGTSTGQSNTSATICLQAALFAPPPVSAIRSKRMPAATKAS